MKRFAGFAVAVGLGLALVASPVAADCQPAGDVARAVATAELAFVGKTLAVDGSVARFGVIEVWAGDVGDEVEVRGSFDDGGFAEDDRTWRLGAEYLVVPYLEGGVLRDNLCTATTEWSEELDNLRPPDAQVRSAEVAAESGPPLPIMVSLAVVTGLLAVSYLAFRRRAG